MLVNEEWVDDEEWVMAKLLEIKILRDKLTEVLESGEISDYIANQAMRYIGRMDWCNKTPEEYWNSSSYSC